MRGFWYYFLLLAEEVVPLLKKSPLPPMVAFFRCLNKRVEEKDV
jgi:hypothetical protein